MHACMCAGSSTRALDGVQGWIHQPRWLCCLIQVKDPELSANTCRGFLLGAFWLQVREDRAAPNIIACTTFQLVGLCECVPLRVHPGTRFPGQGKFYRSYLSIVLHISTCTSEPDKSRWLTQYQCVRVSGDRSRQRGWSARPHVGRVRGLVTRRMPV